MSTTYTIKEVFDEQAVSIEEKLEEVFISFLIEKFNSEGWYIKRRNI